MHDIYNEIMNDYSSEHYNNNNERIHNNNEIILVALFSL